jgi:hypothetical protein
MRFVKTALLAACALALASCASLGLTQAKNLQQQILYGYAGVTASLNTLAQATNAGIVTPAEAGKVNASILVINGELNQALSLVCGAPVPPLGQTVAGYCSTPTNSPSAPAIIASATAALTGISAYLSCKQASATGTQEPSCPLP